MKEPSVPFEIVEVARVYSLIQIGVSWKDALDMPCSLCDGLLHLHKEINEYEQYQTEQETKKMRR